MKRIAILLAALALVGAAAAVAIRQEDRSPSQSPASAPSARPTLALLTSLPLLFAEEFSLNGGGSAALTRLEADYAVIPIGVADDSSLAGKPLLLMAHPRAQPAEALVELDAWVRCGGRLLLLADPRLDWQSSLPLGHALRPPPEFADTGLLAHWGLSLEGPASEGPSIATIAGEEILAASPGRWRLRSKRGCEIERGGFVARCHIGRGRATLIADADFLNVAGPGALDGPTARNLDALVAELARLRRQ